MDRIRVLRIIEYDGPRDWVEHQVANSIQGTKTLDHSRDFSGVLTIRAATIGTYPEIVESEDITRFYEKEPDAPQVQP